MDPQNPAATLNGNGYAQAEMTLTPASCAGNQTGSDGPIATVTSRATPTQTASYASPDAATRKATRTLGYALVHQTTENSTRRGGTNGPETADDFREAGNAPPAHTRRRSIPKEPKRCRSRVASQSG